MWELLLEFIGEICAAIGSWRFYACVLLSLALVGLIQWQVASSGWRLGLSVPVAILGIGAGFVWERRTA